MARSPLLLIPGWHPTASTRIRVATLAAIVIHVAGAIGILLRPEWFVRMTAANLLLMLLLAFWTEDRPSRSLLAFFTVAWMVGMITETIGTHTGILFGNYAYGEVLGPRIFGVPLLIGCNWYLIMRASSGVASRMASSLKPASDDNIRAGGARTSAWMAPLLGALMATLFDWVMEPIAVRLGYWTWLGDGSIPVLNYLTWFAVSWLLLAFAARLGLSGTNRFTARLYLIQLLFFLTLRSGS